MNTQTRAAPAQAGALPKFKPPAATFALPPLPYADDALEPVISARTVEIHYGKHNKGYIDTLYELVAGTPFADLSLEQIVLSTARDPAHAAIFNNAAQAWNHAFYWHSLSPRRGGFVPHALKTHVDSAFGSFDALKEELSTAATTQFGSGWAWLVLDGTK